MKYQPRVLPGSLPSMAISMLVLLCYPPPGSGQNRDTLETKVTSNGDRVTLEWSKKHPWEKDLSDAGPSLFVEYRSGKGVGIDCLPSVQTGARRGACLGISGTPVKGEDRMLSYQLPRVVTAEPLGDVCLYFRMPNQRILPIRRTGRQGEDTARFQVLEWTRQVTEMARKASLDGVRSQIQEAIATQAASIAAQEHFNATKGWTSGPACEALAGGSVLVTQDRPIAEPGEQDEVARTVCVMRLATADALLDDGARQITTDEKKLVIAKLLLALHSGDAQPPATLDLLVGMAAESDRREWIVIRGPQFRQFTADWMRLNPQLAAYRREFPIPHFESFSKTLRLQTLTREAAKRVGDAFPDLAKVDSRDVLGVVGGSLEAYGRCVEDGKRQLDLNYRQSRELKDTLNNLKTRLTEQARQECRAGIEKATSMQQRLTQLQAEMAGIDRRLAEFSIVPLNSRSQVVNSAACTP